MQIILQFSFVNPMFFPLFQPFISYYLLPITYYLLPVTCYLLPVTNHPSGILNERVGAFGEVFVGQRHVVVGGNAELC